MINVFYTPGRGIYLNDQFYPQDLRKEFDETGQVTVDFIGFDGSREATYPTGISNIQEACHSVADQIVRKLKPFFGESQVRTGAIIDMSTKTLSNGKTGVSRIVFQIIPIL